MPRCAAYRAAEWLIARRCHVAAVSHAEAELARRVLHAPHVSVVANGIPELDAAAAQPADRAGALVVGSGRIAPQRRPEASARILRAVSDIAAGPLDRRRARRRGGAAARGRRPGHGLAEP